LPRTAQAALRAAPQFQSHLGSILPRREHDRMLPWMQVSIPPWFDFAVAIPRGVRLGPAGFNPTLVRFCRTSASGICSGVQCFNPTLVRFCPASHAHTVHAAPRFNPTLVRFCPLPRSSTSSARRRFNPTLVRFCPSSSQRRRGTFVTFQSHLGSILPQFFHRHGGPVASVSIPPWFDFAPAAAAQG